MNEKHNPGVTFAHASGTRTISYQHGAPATETYTAGLLAGVQVSRQFDGLDRLSGIAVHNQAHELYSVDYSYNGTTGRLDTVSYDGHSAAYSYQSGGGRVETTTYSSGGSGLTITRTWDDIGRLESIANTPASAADAMSFTYTKFSMHAALAQSRPAQRGNLKGDSPEGGNALGQVTGAEKRQSNDNLLPGYEFAFDFDDIGNRKTATRNGETSTYTVNALNQYEQRTVPGVTEVRGTAAAAATVTVNEQSVQREGEYFFKKLSLDNSQAPVWEEITVKGVIPEGGHDDTDAIAEDTFHRWLPETPEAYSHDADGNLEFDGRWDYTWNGENRLVAMETRPAAYQAGAPRERLEFVYDSQGRRVLKVHLEWDDTEETFVETRRDRFVYHGWNLLLQVTERPDLDAAYVSQRFVWGIDLSGGMQGAGGVGGLLMVRFSGNITAYPAYDGNGNVMGLFDPAEGEWAAEYEYGAFGEPLRSTGPLADRNRFRFSTKYTDSTTGLLYYGFRYYNPETGRWLNRDPIGERGGLNLYGFVGNDGVSAIDLHGLNVLNWLRRLIMPDPSTGGRNFESLQPLYLSNEEMVFDDDGCCSHIRCSYVGVQGGYADMGGGQRASSSLIIACDENCPLSYGRAGIERQPPEVPPWDINRPENVEGITPSWLDHNLEILD